MQKNKKVLKYFYLFDDTRKINQITKVYKNMNMSNLESKTQRNRDKERCEDDEIEQTNIE